MGSKMGRREVLLHAGAILAAAAVLPDAEAWNTSQSNISRSGKSPIRLGVASYSFRKFGRADVIKFMKELDTPYLNVKDMHLPMASAEEIEQASDEFKAAGITLTAAGTIYFTQDDDADMRRKFPELDLILIESGGDNLAATFSPELADLTLYVIDVAAGDKIPSKGGPGITRSDLLVINKIDLAPYVGASLEVMERDTKRMRGSRPFVMTNLREGSGVAEIARFIEQKGGLVA